MALVKKKLSPPGSADILCLQTSGDQVFANDGTTTFESHLTDYTTQIPYSITTGTANTYAISTPVISTLIAGMAISVKINIDSTGASTLNWNGKGAKGIKKSDGTDITTNLKSTGIYTLRYDGTNFVLQGEGGSGNATSSDLLPGKTASSDVGDLVGTYSNIKSIQRGKVTVDAIQKNVTITPVDVNKSLLLISTNYRSTNSGVDPRVSTATAILLSDKVQIDIDEYQSTRACEVCWQVIEFNNVKSVQRGLLNTANTNTIVNISAVNGNKSFVVENNRVDVNSGNISDDIPVSIEFYGGSFNQIAINKSNNGNSIFVAWQVIEFN